MQVLVDERGKYGLPAHNIDRGDLNAIDEAIKVPLFAGYHCSYPLSKGAKIRELAMSKSSHFRSFFPSSVSIEVSLP